MKFHPRFLLVDDVLLDVRRTGKQLSYLKSLTKLTFA